MIKHKLTLFRGVIVKLKVNTDNGVLVNKENKYLQGVNIQI